MADLNEQAADAMARLWRPQGAEQGPWLLCNDDGRLTTTLRRDGHQVLGWNRWSKGSERGVPSPPTENYAGALLRIPKEKQALEFALHLIAGRLKTGQPLWLYGGNKEGIKSAKKALSPLYEAIESVGAKNHCRVWSGVRSEHQPKGDLADWWQRSEINLDGTPCAWSSLPGVFARGRLDPATALLIEALPTQNEKVSILDFGCGPGAISRALQNRYPRADLHLLDADAIALVCARVNVPSVHYYESDGWAHAPSGPFDLIVSNPPIHAGKVEDHRMLDTLITESPKYLMPGGQLILVGQGRLRLEARMKQVFRKPVMLNRNSRFQVWSSR